MCKKKPIPAVDGHRAAGHSALAARHLRYCVLMKVEIYCFTPPDSRPDISWKLPLLSSVERGNLGLHKGRHLVKFA
jgi:hypothetical protein